MPSDTFNQNEGENFGGASQDANRADLEKQVGKLREDVAGIAETLKGLAGNRADSYRQQAFALRDDIRSQGEQYLRAAQETANDLEEQFSEKVRSEPIKYVLIAAGVGYLYARLFH